MDSNEIFPTTPAPQVEAPRQRRERGPKRTKVAGSDLVPDLNKPGLSQREYYYWVGVTPSCPRESLDCAGINFPKVNEDLIIGADRNGRKERVKRIGALVKLTKAKFDKLRERLPHLVMRMLSTEGVKDEPGTGQNLGDLHVRPQKGHPIRIPTLQELEEKRNLGLAANPYIPHPNDVPAARFMFCVLCEDQEKGNRGETYPETLETAGLEWPED